MDDEEQVEEKGFDMGDGDDMDEPLDMPDKDFEIDDDPEDRFS